MFPGFASAKPTTREESTHSWLTNSHLMHRYLVPFVIRSCLPPTLVFRHFPTQVRTSCVISKRVFSAPLFPARRAGIVVHYDEMSSSPRIPGARFRRGLDWIGTGRRLGLSCLVSNLYARASSMGPQQWDDCALDFRRHVGCYDPYNQCCIKSSTKFFGMPAYAIFSLRTLSM